MRLRSSASRRKDVASAPSLYSLIQQATTTARDEFGPNVHHDDDESPTRDLYKYVPEAGLANGRNAENLTQLSESAVWPENDDQTFFGLSEDSGRLAAQIGDAIANFEATVEDKLDGTQIFTIMGIDLAGECAVFAVNFASLCARRGYRTLLVDANLQSPVHNELLGVDNETGVSDFLESAEPAWNFIRRTQMDNLAIMPAGNRYKNPASLLERERLTHRLQSVASSFDLILLDGGSLPPQVASRLAVGATGAIFVAKKGGSSLRQLQQLQVSLEQKGARAVGAVIVE